MSEVTCYFFGIENALIRIYTTETKQKFLIITLTNLANHTFGPIPLLESQDSSYDTNDMDVHITPYGDKILYPKKFADPDKNFIARITRGLRNQIKKIFNLRALFPTKFYPAGGFNRRDIISINGLLIDLSINGESMYDNIRLNEDTQDTNECRNSIKKTDLVHPNIEEINSSYSNVEAINDSLGTQDPSGSSTKCLFDCNDDETIDSTGMIYTLAYNSEEIDDQCRSSTDGLLDCNDSLEIQDSSGSSTEGRLACNDEETIASTGMVYNSEEIDDIIEEIFLGSNVEETNRVSCIKSFNKSIIDAVTDVDVLISVCVFINLLTRL